MSTIPAEVFLARQRSEAEARGAADQALRVSITELDTRLTNEVSKLSKKVSATNDGQTVDASAIAGLVQRVQVEPGFALAEQVTMLEARVGENFAAYNETITVLVDQFHAEATKTETLTARFARTESNYTEIIHVLSDPTTGLAMRTATLETKIDTPTTGLLARVSTVESTKVDATGALAQAGSAIYASLTGTAAGTIGAAITAEATARAEADGRVSGQYALRVVAGGKVAGMTVTAADGLSGGSGYTSTPTVALVNYPGTPGSGATATATVVGGVITAITVTSPGSGYTVPPKVVVTGGGGSGARAVSTLVGGGVFQVLVAPTSEIAFADDVFKIYTSAGNVAPFEVSGTTVRMANAVVSGVLDIGNNYIRSRIDSSGMVFGYGEARRIGFESDGVSTMLNHYVTNHCVSTLRAYTSAGLVDTSELALTSYLGGSVAVVTSLAPGRLTSTAGLKLHAAGTLTLEATLIAIEGSISELTVSGTASAGSLSSSGSLTVSGAAQFNSGFSSFGSCAIFGGLGLTGTVVIPTSSASSPALAFQGDSNTGIFSDAADRLSLSAGGSEVARLINLGGGNVYFKLSSGVQLQVGNTKQSVTSETVTHYVTAVDASGTTLKLAVLS